MIESLHVQHFQSLDDVTIELAPFTVIVGPSSSGKSALIRATHTLIANRRGHAFISHGERIASITAKTSHGTVTLTRGKGTSDNSYVIIPTDPAHPLAPQTTYSKLGGEVPVEVSRFLGIDPKDPIAFASQFDKPYLLDDSPAEIARTLGALTNATVLLEGARESNRRKLDTKRTLTTRTTDLAAITAKVPAYRALGAQRDALTEAEQHIERARALTSDIDSLTRALEAHEINAQRVHDLAGAADFEVPDEQALLDAARVFLGFRKDLAELVSATRAADEAYATLTDAELEHTAAERAYDESLGGLAAGFEAHMREHGQTVDDRSSGAGDSIMVDEAAELAARYVESFIRG
ncbi:hypothetical protein SEA_MAGRITTE_155 [Microbacterium phage Magritte]|nr:hypothetical protein SEA_MAGRITTE_155 [Microbacterium phage Magritte]